MVPSFVTGQEVISASGGRLSVEPGVADMMASAVSAAIRSYCSWHVAPIVEETMTLDYDGGGILTLPTLRLEEIISLTVDGQDIPQPEWSHTGDIKLGRRPSKWRGVKAHVRHGYDLAQVADLKQVALQAALVGLASPTGVVRESAGQVSIEFARTGVGVAGGLTLLERDMLVLDAYRLPRRA